MIFPEGVPGIIKPWSQRYQLKKFRVGHAELAIRHGAPIVPVGIVGAEEQLPALVSSRRLGKSFGIESVPFPSFLSHCLFVTEYTTVSPSLFIENIFQMPQMIRPFEVGCRACSAGCC